MLEEVGEQASTLGWRKPKMMSEPSQTPRRSRLAKASDARLIDSSSIKIGHNPTATAARVCAVLALALGVGALVWPSFAMTTRLALALVAVIASAFYGLAWQVLRTRALEAPRWPVVASLVDVTLATTAVSVIALLEGPELAAAGVGTGAYFLTIGLAATRLRAVPVLITTGLALAQWLAIDLILVRPALGDLAWSAPGTGWEWTWERMGWLAALGAVAAASTFAVRQRSALVDQRMERRLERELGRYLSRNVARAILRGKVDLGKPQRRVVTVLFCDLRGFTFLCERERPEDVVEILDTFFERAFQLVQKHGGTVSKVLGDGLLALFNAPDDLADHAVAAADAADDIQRMVHRLRERGGVWTHVAVGIGLDTGDIVAGPIGSTDRAEYTAIGSPVNRAARLQSLGERDSRRIILSEATSRALAGRREVKLIGEVELKGFAGPERVYALSKRASTNGPRTPLASTRSRTLDRAALAANAIEPLEPQTEQTEVEDTDADDTKV